MLVLSSICHPPRHHRLGHLAIGHLATTSRSADDVVRWLVLAFRFFFVVGHNFELVGGWATPLKNMSSSIKGWLLFPILMGKFKKWQPNHPPVSNDDLAGIYIHKIRAQFFDHLCASSSWRIPKMGWFSSGKIPFSKMEDDYKGTPMTSWVSPHLRSFPDKNHPFLETPMTSWKPP